jgi:histidine phosphotransfer protein HptB
MSQSTSDAPIFSIFADDEDLGELITLFVDEIPLRIESLLEAAHDADWEGVRRLAHQLKGAGGSYGFQEVTEVAAHLERTCLTPGDPETLQAALEEMVQTCRRMRSGSTG